MEVASEKQQWVLASLGFLLAALIVGLYLFGSGLIPVPEGAPVAGVFALNIALGVFALPLVWWGSRWGYVGALAFGVVSLVNFALGLGAIVGGSLPADLLIIVIPFLLVTLFLFYAAGAAWRE